MKLHKLISRITSSVLAVMLLATAMPMTAFASQQAELTYSFANDKAGFAEGKITLTLSDTADYGNYTLYWADDENVLSGYYPITTLTAVGGLASFSFLENIVIPPDATKLVAFAENSSDQTSVSSASFVYNVPQSKQNPNKSTDKTLSFEALSDTQLDMQSTVFYTYSQKHFALALEDAADRNVDFVTTSGDCINNYENGTSKEWQGFQKIIADSSYTNPIYETNGNHSMKSDINYGLEAYKAATGLGVDNEGLGDAPYYEITAKNGDHFIFVALEADDSPGTSDEFSTEQLDWLESTIEKYYDDGHRIFIFEHAFFHGWGPGDDKEQHYYSGGLRTTSEYPNNLRFKEILDTYNEVFCYTGHSHFDFMYNWNYDNENGEACNLFHIPATACTTHITNGKIDYSMDENSSQCYIVDCYDDMVISNGLNVVDNLIYPQYSYIVDTSGYTHEPNVKPTEGTTEPTTESSNMIDVQVNNTTSFLYSEGAAVFFYNNDSGNHFPVDSTTGIAQIPENATNLTLYRCNGSWNSGLETKSDSVTSFWNKFGPVQRAEGQLIFNVAGSSKYSWGTGEIVYPSTEPTTEPQESTAPVTANESTIYWAIPKDFTDLGYTFRINLKTSAGTYPHSALVLTDTGETYNGLEVYSYTFSEAYTAEYDTAGIARIQLQAAESASTSAKMYAQYAFTDKTYTVSELNGKIFVSPDASPSGTKTATSSGWISYKQVEPDPTEATEPTTEATANESTIYWAIPKDFTDLGYTFRINLKTSAGTYPHSALVLTDTGETYNGLEVYSYTFSEAYTAEYDTAGIARIQLQAAESASTSAKMYAQYAFTDKTYTVSELNGKIFVSPDASPSGTKTATSSGWISYKQVEPDPTEATEPTTEATANESTIYWAIPKDFTDLGYTFRINLKTSAGTYPHSALVLTDTGETYNGLEVYSYTFSEAYTAEYDTAGIARIQLQAAESASTSAKMYAQYAFTDKTYTVSELNGKIFVSPDASPSGTKTATSSGWISYKGSVDDPTEPPTEATEPTTLPYEAVEIKVLDATSSGWVYTAGAVLYVYDKDTGNYYTVADEKAYIPKEAVNLTVYRCDGAWSVGNKNDGIASYWNKWDLSTRADGFDIINLGGSDTFTWLSSASYKPEVDVKYYLLGYFNGADYESRDYKFDENGSLEMKFTDDSYVYVVSSSNTSYYTNGWLGYDSTSAVLYRSTSLSNPDKFYVPAGIATFTLVSNEDGSLTLSYELEPNELDKTEIEPIYEDMQIGDVNNDGKISVKDATMIQKYIGEAITFTSEMFYCADVYGNGTVNVRSATLIQKRAADSFDLFPAEEGYKADVRDLGSLLTVAGETLYTDYRYASFVAYSKLKTQYYAYKDVDLEALSKSETEEAYANLYAAYANFNEMKENNTISTVYFCNDIGWSNVKAYCYNSSTGKYINAFDNAQGISKVKILKSGVKILEITLNQEKWDKIIFTNGDGSQTVSLDVPKQNCIGYYFTDCQTDEKGRLIPNKFRYTYDRI